MGKQDTGSLRELKTALREDRLDRLYVFFGEESFLQNYYLDQIRKRRIDEITESFNYHKFTKENFDLLLFADAVESLPMMAEHTLVIVDDIEIFKLQEDDRNKLISVLNDIPEYCTVIFSFEAIPWKPDKRMKQLWDAIDKNATMVEFPKQDPRELINWITRHFAANKKRIAPNLCNYLIEITGGTMTALSGEIAKISAYSGSDEITKSDIDAVTEPVLDCVVFHMTDLLSEGRYERAIVELEQLMQMQEEPIKVLGAIGMQFRRISAAKILAESGKTEYDLMELYPMYDSTARKTFSAARRFTSDFCDKAMRWILDADLAMKTSQNDQERILESLLFALAQEARNG